MRRSNRWHRPSGSSRSTTSFATCSPLDDIGFAPAISDFCARARSLRGTPWQRPDDFDVEIIPNVAVVDVNLTAPPPGLETGKSSFTLRQQRVVQARSA